MPVTKSSSLVSIYILFSVILGAVVGILFGALFVANLMKAVLVVLREVERRATLVVDTRPKRAPSALRR